MYYILGDVGTSSLSSSLLSLLSSNANAMSIKLPSSSVQAEVNHLFTITMCNFMGTCSSAAHSVYVLSKDVPLADLSISTTQLHTWHRRVDLLYDVNYFDLRSSSSCASDYYQDSNSDMYEYQWAIFDQASGAELTQYTTQAKVPSIYYLPAYTLPAGLVYKLVLSAYEATSSIAASSSVSIYISVGDVVSVIDGGIDSTSIKFGEAYEIYGSESYDNDISPSSTSRQEGLSFLWSCYLQYTPNATASELSCPLIISNITASVAEITLGGSDLEEGSIIRLFLQVPWTSKLSLTPVRHLFNTSPTPQVSSSDGRTHTSYIDLHVVTDYVPTISITYTNSVSDGSGGSGSSFGSTHMKFSASIAWPVSSDLYDNGADMIIRWKHDDEDDIEALSPLSLSLNAMGSTTSHLNLVLPTAFLSLRSLYTFTCRVYDGSTGVVFAASSISVHRNMPPSPGLLYHIIS